MLAGSQRSEAVRATARELLDSGGSNRRKSKGRQKAKAKVRQDQRPHDETRGKRYLVETFGCQMNVHDSERMAGLLEQAGYEPAQRCARRRRRGGQHLQRPRARRGQALYPAWRAPRPRRRNRPAAGRRGGRMRGAAGGRRAAVQDQRPRDRRRAGHAAGEAAAGARRAGPRDGARRRRAGRWTSARVRRRDVPGRRRAARRRRARLRDHHRGLQRPLRLLRRAPHAGPRADARQARHPARTSRRPWRRAGPRCSSSARSSTTTRRRTIRPAISPACSRPCTRCRALRRIRFASPHPRHTSQRLIEAIRDLPRVCKHFHLPLQSGSTRVLRAMRRRHTREEYLELVGRIRDAVPGITLSTDLIVGFPGETAEDFERHDVDARRGPATTACSRSSTRRGRTRWQPNACPTTSPRTRRRAASWRCRRCSGTIQLELHEAAVGPVPRCWWIRSAGGAIGRWPAAPAATRW